MADFELQFCWDERKNRQNYRKHGIRFETAVLVFSDPFHVTAQDREVDGEPRWQTIGMVEGLQILLVAHTDFAAEDKEVVRIILARKATRAEQGIYAEQIENR
jgi:uncharacterized protein